MTAGCTVQALAALHLLSCAPGHTTGLRRADDNSWRTQSVEVGHSTLVSGGGSASNGRAKSTPRPAYDSARVLSPAASIKAVLLHRSTGGMIYLNGRLADWITQYNSSHHTAYVVNELTYPIESVGYETESNWPWDYWQIWVRHAGTATYHGQPTLEILTQQYQVIIWKHCFTAAYVTDDTGQASLSSKERRVENYKLHYAALKTKMREFPATQFIVWTMPAPGAMDASNARLGTTFVNWVRNTWDEPGDNIYLWDFRQLETNGGDLALPKNITTVDDAHPSQAFSTMAVPLLGQRFVNVVEGRGDTSSLTGQ